MMSRSLPFITAMKQGARRPSLTVMGLILLFFLAACGGGGGEEAESPAGVTYSPEGSKAEPVEILSGTPHTGQVDDTQSYYVLNSGGCLYFTLSGMADDLDLYVYGQDSTYSTFVSRPFYGRTEDETSWAIDYGPGPVYVMVDGSYSAAGSEFALEAISSPLSCLNSVIGGPPPGFDEGTQGDPIVLSANRPQRVQVGLTSSYYKVAVSPGTRYTLALTDAFGGTAPVDVDLFVYGVPTFTGDLCGTQVVADSIEQCTLVAGGDTFYISLVNANGDGTGNGVMTLTVLSAEGSQANPITLFVDKLNFGHVNDQASYYAFDVTPGMPYRSSLQIYGTNGELNDYGSDGTFSTTPCTQAAGGRVPAQCDSIAAGSRQYVAITDGASARGSYYLLQLTYTPLEVVSAVATDCCTVAVTFNRDIDPASVLVDGSQFTFDLGLVSYGATVSGNVVTVSELPAQSIGGIYTITVESTVLDTNGLPVDPNANTATFSAIAGG